VNLKEKAAQDAGIKTDIRRMPATAPDEQLEEIIRTWNTDPGVNAILIQLPLPSGHDTDRIVAAMDPLKDVDGFHPETVKRLLSTGDAIISPVHEAVLRLIAATGFDPRNKTATILANSGTFALPLSHLLQKAGFITAIMDPDMLDGDVLRTSDVIVSAVGRSGFLGADLVKPGSVIIDVGTSKDEHGKIRGDADADSLNDIDGWLTPSPGGVGPMTVALLLKNVVMLASRQL
jgi:methylenetetrahydrofolate dehydrogenase (NADP+)/methenyltetrahydrofolate cyclohydrolase